MIGVVSGSEAQYIIRKGWIYMATEHKFVRILLKTTPEQEEAFQELQEAYRRACQFISDYIFEHELGHIKSFNAVFAEVFKKEIGPDVQNKYGLKCAMTYNLIQHVCNKYHAIQKRYGLSHITKALNFKYSQILYPNNVCTFHKRKNTIGIQLLEGAKPAHCGYDRNIWHKYRSWKRNKTMLLYKARNWYLCLLMQNEGEDFTKDTVKHVVGIDIGLNYLMYTYDDLGNSMAFDGGEILAEHDKYKIRGDELNAIDTEEAINELELLVDEKQQWIAKINQDMINFFEEKYGDHTLYVIEDINLRKKTAVNTTLKVWRFEKMLDTLQRMSSKTNSWVLRVSPQYTSQRCAKCGIISETNRNRKKHEYRCKCGFSSNDDLNAAMNIYQLGLRKLNGEKNLYYEKESSLSVITPRSFASVMKRCGEQNLWPKN